MTRMYKERIENIAAFRGCKHNCIYCAFKNSLARSSCPKCRAFEPHEHLECFERTPPKTKGDEFITIGLCGDVAFASDEWFRRAIEYCEKWSDRTFLIQSKNPEKLMLSSTGNWDFPKNIIIGTTIESNRFYPEVSKAPPPLRRYEAMRCDIKNKKSVTIEPILDFDFSQMVGMIRNILPDIVWVGYNSRQDVRLPEPSLAKTQALIKALRDAGLDVREKLMREAKA